MISTTNGSSNAIFLCCWSAAPFLNRAMLLDSIRRWSDFLGMWVRYLLLKQWILHMATIVKSKSVFIDRVPILDGLLCGCKFLVYPLHGFTPSLSGHLMLALSTNRTPGVLDNSFLHHDVRMEQHCFNVANLSTMIGSFQVDYLLKVLGWITMFGCLLAWCWFQCWRYIGWSQPSNFECSEDYEYLKYFHQNDDCFAIVVGLGNLNEISVIEKT